MPGLLETHAEVVSELHDLFARVHLHTGRNLLPWHSGGTRVWPALHASLRALDERMAQQAPALHAYWRLCGDRFLAALSTQTRWRQGEVTPFLTRYVEVAETSTGIYWLAATVLALTLNAEARPPRPGGLLMAAIRSIARSTRLLSDVADERELHWRALRRGELARRGLESEAAAQRALEEVLALAAGEGEHARALLEALRAERRTAAVALALAALLPDDGVAAERAA